MKKSLYIIILITLFFEVSSCSSYKPVYGNSNFNFIISEYSISGNARLGDKIYSRLVSASKSNDLDSDKKNISILINVSKTKRPTNKDSAGKILGYKINLNTSFLVKNFDTGNEILNEKFSLNSSYSVQDQIFETKQIEEKSIDQLINRISQNLLIKLSKNIL